MDEVPKLGTRLRDLRTRRGLSAAKLAKEAGISRDHVYRLERGDRKGAGSLILTELARVLHTSADYLTGKEDDPDALPSPPAVPVPAADLVPLVEEVNRMPAPSRRAVTRLFQQVLDTVRELNAVESPLLAEIRYTLEGLPYEKQTALLHLAKEWGHESDVTGGAAE